MKKINEDIMYCLGQSVAITVAICIAFVGYVFFSKAICAVFKLLGLTLNPIGVFVLLWVVTVVLFSTCFIARKHRINKALEEVE